MTRINSLAGSVPTRIATMYRLDDRGRIVETRYVEYHSCSWMNLCSIGFITHTVDELGG